MASLQLSILFKFQPNISPFDPVNNGDELVCHNAIFKDVTGLSSENHQMLSQNGVKELPLDQNTKPTAPSGDLATDPDNPPTSPGSETPRLKTHLDLKEIISSPRIELSPQEKLQQIFEIEQAEGGLLKDLMNLEEQKNKILQKIQQKRSEKDEIM